MRHRVFLTMSVFAGLLANCGCGNPGVGDVPAAAAASPAKPDPQSFDRTLSMPLSSASLAQLQDTFNQGRGSERRHEATDIAAPLGTPVLAVDDGIIQKLFLSKPGGLTIYHFDPTSRFCYYYAHLKAYAEGLKEGMNVTRGQVIGYVGVSGNAPPQSPHLHFG
ncbi:MAG TPA: M23 family metallopeptidase, partial [Bryobacteraceae bacterium]|nr:M23 family metallopeptidase [Bryobacteraceae bacterium]